MEAHNWLGIVICISQSATMSELNISLFSLSRLRLDVAAGTVNFLDLNDLAGIFLGTWIFALMYPKLKDGILKMGDFGNITLHRLLKVNDCIVVVPAVALIVLLLFWIEKAGF